MPTPQQQQEADAVEGVYQWALVQLGIGAIMDAKSNWSQFVPTNGEGADYSAWMAQARRYISIRRSWMVELALEYYRLIRALRTGETIAIPGHDNENVSIESLRLEFEDTIGKIIGQPYDGGKSLTPGEDDDPLATAPEPSLPPLTPSDDDPIKVVNLDIDIQQTIDRLNQEAQAQIDASLQKYGPDAFEKALSEMDTSESADDVDKDRSDQHRKAGNRTAAEAERISLLAARGLTYNLGEADKAAIGWVRYSKTGTPCAWCAMLISRGAVFYQSRTTAGTKGDNAGSVQEDIKELGQQFHTNCHCTAVPVFSMKQYLNSPIFAMNRRYHAIWAKHIKGKFSGNDALNAWRTMFRHGEISQHAYDAA